MGAGIATSCGSGCQSGTDDALEAPGLESFPVISEDKGSSNGHVMRSSHTVQSPGPVLSFPSPTEQSQASHLRESSQTLPERFAPTNEAGTNDENGVVVSLGSRGSAGYGGKSLKTKKLIDVVVDENGDVVAAHNDESIVELGSKAVFAPTAQEEHEQKYASTNHVPDHAYKNGGVNGNMNTHISALEKLADDAVGVQSAMPSRSLSAKRRSKAKAKKTFKKCTRSCGESCSCTSPRYGNARRPDASQLCSK